MLDLDLGLTDSEPSIVDLVIGSSVVESFVGLSVVGPRVGSSVSTSEVSLEAGLKISYNGAETIKILLDSKERDSDKKVPHTISCPIINLGSHSN